MFSDWESNPEPFDYQSCAHNFMNSLEFIVADLFLRMKKITLFGNFNKIFMYSIHFPFFLKNRKS